MKMDQEFNEWYEAKKPMFLQERLTDEHVKYIMLQAFYFGKSRIQKKERKHIEERKKVFYESLIQYTTEFGKKTVRAFFDYWSEHNERGLKMRFEMEKVFNKRMRLITWKRNNEKWIKSNKAEPATVSTSPFHNMKRFEEYNRR